MPPALEDDACVEALLTRAARSAGAFTSGVQSGFPRAVAARASARPSGQRNADVSMVCGGLAAVPAYLDAPVRVDEEPSIWSETVRPSTWPSDRAREEVDVRHRVDGAVLVDHGQARAPSCVSSPMFFSISPGDVAAPFLDGHGARTPARRRDTCEAVRSSSPRATCSPKFSTAIATPTHGASCLTATRPPRRCSSSASPPGRAGGRRRPRCRKWRASCPA